MEGYLNHGHKLEKAVLKRKGGVYSADLTV
jgi:hypothetical protein